MLCDYDTGVRKYHAGERILLLENNDASHSRSMDDTLRRDTESSLSGEDSSSDSVGLVDTGPTFLCSHHLMRDYHTESSRSTIRTYWTVRGFNDSLTQQVPSICVWIAAPDQYTKQTAQM